ncbi:MAG: flagellar protein FlaG [Solibacillus sp.]
MMRIGSQGDAAIQASKFATQKAETPKVEAPKATVESTIMKQKQTVKPQNNLEEQKDVVSKEKLEEAVNSINEFLHTQNKASKFVFHDGLDKYYVQLVDAETDEIIKEIPPERLLNAFYEMKKLAGMIVDEKI